MHTTRADCYYGGAFVVVVGGGGFKISRGGQRGSLLVRRCYIVEP